MAKKFIKQTPKNRCRFIIDGRCIVDYKDVRQLSRFITPQGRIYSRKRSGACAQSQAHIKASIKRARFLALIPYPGQHQN
jgi:small subunit ribosomal protein S18